MGACKIFFPKLLYFCMPITECLCLLSFETVGEALCDLGASLLCWGCFELLFWGGLWASPHRGSVPSAAHTLGDGGWGCFRCSLEIFLRIYCNNVRLALRTAEHIIKGFACCSRSGTEQRRGWWMPLWTSQPHPWGLVQSLSRSPRGHPSLTKPDLMAFPTTFTCCTLMRIF